tara:strand:- start:574 stop:1074 length:501 start_codon:yes stop_codon:yes gene_type:complete
MATALFISRTDLVKNTILDGNVDTDKFIQFVKISQEIHIQNYLGSKLYDRISADIVAGTLAGDYLALVVDYIQPMLIHFAMMDYLPFAAFQVSNGGIFKHNSENSQTASKDEVDFLVQKERSFAEYYTRRFVDFICFDSTKFPEYNNNTEADVYPEKRVQYSNFVL